MKNSPQKQKYLVVRMNQLGQIIVRDARRFSTWEEAKVIGDEMNIADNLSFERTHSSWVAVHQDEI